MEDIKEKIEKILEGSTSIEEGYDGADEFTYEAFDKDSATKELLELIEEIRKDDARNRKC